MAIEKIEPLRIKLTKLLPYSSLLCVALHNLLDHLLLHINVLLGQPVLLSLSWKKVPGKRCPRRKSSFVHFFYSPTSWLSGVCPPNCNQRREWFPFDPSEALREKKLLSCRFQKIYLETVFRSLAVAMKRTFNCGWMYRNETKFCLQPKEGRKEGFFLFESFKIFAGPHIPISFEGFAFDKPGWDRMELPGNDQQRLNFALDPAPDR